MTRRLVSLAVLVAVAAGCDLPPPPPPSAFEVTKVTDIDGCAGAQ